MDQGISVNPTIVEANIVADALSRKTRCSLNFLAANNWEVLSTLQEFQLMSLEVEETMLLFKCS